MSANFLCCSCSAPSNLIFELVNSQTDELFKTLERERERESVRGSARVSVWVNFDAAVCS